MGEFLDTLILILNKLIITLAFWGQVGLALRLSSNCNILYNMYDNNNNTNDNYDDDSNNYIMNINNAQIYCVLLSYVVKFIFWNNYIRYDSTRRVPHFEGSDGSVH